ncbi:MAG: hypothetical protein J3R72DRAFT_202049 [Linnemannia gamsii]|nr:MAG: hypothetical protein J3R72DRAFT_202049 [Linnemannia gamsii]
MQAQERAQAVYSVDHNGLSPTTGATPTVGEIVYINSHLDPAAGMEIMYWRDIRAVFNDAVYVRHNSRTLAYLKGNDGNNLIPLRIAALHRAVMEIVVDTPPSPPAAHVQSRGVTPLAPRPAQPTLMHRRPPPATSHIVPRAPVPPKAQQIPRPTARGTMCKIASHINLSQLQEKGEGEKKDFPKVLECYLKAVHKGHAYAQFAVGKLYFDATQDGHSMGVVQDYTRAMEWFIRAANLGDAGAQNEIGVLYTQGHGVTQDYKNAMEWLTKAADHGHAIAPTNIGMLSLQGRIQALLAQNYELHEYPIPRLFIILPKKTSWKNPMSLINSQFQLQFLCECGEHTKVLSGDNTNIPHYIHIAKHAGYDLQRSTEFFQKYGRYMLTLLEMIKHGSTNAGYLIPALPSVNLSGAIEISTKSQDSITPVAINQSIAYLQTFLSEQGAAKDINMDSFARQEALEGADLGHLKLFIKGKDQDPALGNLYRTITEEGHVKWVCIDHYRLAYMEQDQQAFVTAVRLNGGQYNLHLGIVTVWLGSKLQAAGFFKALAKARCVNELDVKFDWEVTTSDFEAFGDTLESTAVSILRLDIQRYRIGFARKVESTNMQQTLDRCINLPSMKMIHVVLPVNLFELSTLQPKRLSFPPKLSFEVVSRRGGFTLGMCELTRLTEILKTCSTLTTLYLRGNSIGDNGAVALSEALKTNSTLTTLSLYGNSIGDNGAVALSEALTINSTLTTLNLSDNWIEEDGAVALSEALKTNSTLTTLNLKGNFIREKGAVALSEALKTNSTLNTLDLRYTSFKDYGAVALSDVLKINSTVKVSR